MGKAGREKVVLEFSDTVVIDKILKLYKELTNGYNNKKGIGRGLRTDR